MPHPSGSVVLFTNGETSCEFFQDLGRDTLLLPALKVPLRPGAFASMGLRVDDAR